MTRIIGIARKLKKRAPMETLGSVLVTLEKGVEGDFRGKPGKRQITVLSQSAWDLACSEIGVELDWTNRRANILVDDINLKNSDGKLLEIGEVELLVTQETDPCERMEEVHTGLFATLAKDWRGGVCCRVIKPGEIRLGDKVKLRD